MSKNQKLKREVRQQAVTRLEEAARTQEEFENVLIVWEKLEENIERNKRRKFISRSEELLNWETSGDTIIPAPMHHMSWRQLMRGDFLDVIFDCPYELHELISSRSVSEFVKALNENQKEVLYFKVIRLYSIQRIAAMRGQTDRNVLKVYTTLINSLQKKLFERLYPRWEKNEPLILAQCAFVECYIRQEKGKKKTTVDGGADK